MARKKTSTVIDPHALSGSSGSGAALSKEEQEFVQKAGSHQQAKKAKPKRERIHISVPPAFKEKLARFLEENPLEGNLSLVAMRAIDRYIEEHNQGE